jgi:hypothetical protein
VSEDKKVKERFIELVREQLKTKQLPKEIRIDSGAVIIDPAKFFESHLTVVQSNTGNVKMAFGIRLSKALRGIGIDINDLKKKAEQEIKEQ